MKPFLFKFRIRKNKVLIVKAGLLAVVYTLMLYMAPNLRNLLVKILVPPRPNIRIDDIDSYPLEIPDANQLVEDLRSSRRVELSPINFKFFNLHIFNDTIKCSNEHSKTFSVFILIKTSPSEAELRALFRESFRNETSSLTKPFFQYGFLVGQSEEDISSEISKYQDFIVGDFQDTYMNLTLKTMMGIRWAIEFCPHFDFLVSLDVNTPIYIKHLVRFLKDPYDYPYINNDREFGSELNPENHFYAGAVVHPDITPVRDPESKWFLSNESYPWPNYPIYVHGYFVLMSRATVTSFYYLSPFVEPLDFEDVYLGFLAHKLRITPFEMNQFIFDGGFAEYYDEEYYRESYLKQAVAITNIEYLLQYMNEPTANPLHNNDSVKEMTENSNNSSTLSENAAEGTTEATAIISEKNAQVSEVTMSSEILGNTSSQANDLTFIGNQTNFSIHS